MSFLTGSPAKSSNQAYGYLQNSLSGTVNNGNQANNALAGLLGVGGDPTAAASGYQNFLNSSGYQNIVNSSNRGVTDSAAAHGLLQSGSTLKALQNNSANLGQNYFSNYLSQLGGLSSNGLQASSVIGGAGQQQQGATGGLIGSLGSIGQAVGGLATLSDRRLKRAITLVGRMASGLGIYRFKYLWSRKEHIGVMAQEVAQLCPQALGPRWFGFMSVRYDRLV